MKKTDFPDKCSPCRLANREKMRAALEGILLNEEERKESKSLYALEIKEDSKKGKGPKKSSGKHNVSKAIPQEKPTNSKFEDIMKEVDINFPSLADSDSKE